MFTTNMHSHGTYIVTRKGRCYCQVVTFIFGLPSRPLLLGRVLRLEQDAAPPDGEDDDEVADADDDGGDDEQTDGNQG